MLARADSEDVAAVLVAYVRELEAVILALAAIGLRAVFEEGQDAHRYRVDTAKLGWAGVSGGGTGCALDQPAG